MVLFGYGERHRRGKFEPPEVVAICDRLAALGAAELEDKIGGKAPDVALDLLVQMLGGHAVERGQVGAHLSRSAVQAAGSLGLPRKLWP